MAALLPARQALGREREAVAGLDGGLNAEVGIDASAGVFSLAPDAWLGRMNSAWSVSVMVTAAEPNPLMVTVGPSAAWADIMKPTSIAVTRVERIGCVILSPRY
ncbi:hypothetical protein LP419_01700 [Massilia sp. H-1]|nr:hypothetical protein LP419_01700 [Massilia sp. H-1]